MPEWPTVTSLELRTPRSREPASVSVHIKVDPSALSVVADNLRRSVAHDPTALAAGAGGGLFRRTANTDEYPGLGVPMQLRQVRPYYAKGGP